MAHDKPAHEIRLGSIRVTIWANQTAKGDVWFNVSVARVYQDQDQDQWKTATSYRRDDLPLVAKGVEMAYAWIWNQHQVPRQAAV